MTLNERKIKILQSIINDYIATGEPVGSRTIAKKYDMGISSATIRNEMSDLEDMGLIIQPHTSAGRIPSDMGYRLYVDQLMKLKEVDSDKQQFLQGIISKNIDSIEYLMEESAKALAMLTNYTTLISGPLNNKTTLKKINLLNLDENHLMIVTATGENYITNHVAPLFNVPDDATLHIISARLNDLLRDKELSEITDEMVDDIYHRFVGYEDIIEAAFAAIKKTMNTAENVHIHMSGAKNILTFPEFSDVEKAKTLFQTLEEKERIAELLSVGGNEIDVMIGGEISIEEMQDCSLITATYDLGNNNKGKIGILGPTRMDYPQVVSILNSMVRNIETAMQKSIGVKKNGS